MPKQDIVAGLKNALEHGSSPEQAKQSFINAGYSREEIEEAAQFIHSGSVPAIGEAEIPPPAQKSIQPAPGQPAKESFFKRNWKLFLLFGILVILIIILILTFIFRDKLFP